MATCSSRRHAPLRIAVLAGGESPERDISLCSGAAVLRALQDRGHHATQIDPADCKLADCSWNDYDIAFLALHGPFGEDGQIQRILEEIGIPFTGSDSTVSHLAFSKSASKERFLQNSVPTPPYVLIHETDSVARVQQHAASLGFPLVVKPDGQGSSLGVSIVWSHSQLRQAVSRCFRYDTFGVLETAIVGTEWTLGMLDDIVLPLIQIKTDRGFFDYTAKYVDNTTQYKFEFDLPPHIIQAVESAGRNACDALGTQGFPRVDIRLDQYHQPWVLEVNTIPGLTNHSLIPKAAMHLGMDFADFCERVIENCFIHSPANPHSS